MRFGLPFISGPQLLLLVGGVYIASQHEQGKHGQPNMLCPICWLNKIAPAAPPSDETPTASPE